MPLVRQAQGETFSTHTPTNPTPHPLLPMTRLCYGARYVPDKEALTSFTGEVPHATCDTRAHVPCVHGTLAFRARGN